MAELTNRTERGSVVELKTTTKNEETDVTEETNNDGLVDYHPRKRGPLISIGSADEFKNESHEAEPFFNNQNTILMIARSCNGDLMLMHETRIFYFSYLGQDDNDNNNNDRPKHSIDTVLSDDTSYAEAADHMTSLILGMLTTRKYRLLTSFYLLWHILDTAMAIALFGLLFFSDDHKSLLQIIWDYIWIFMVLLIEIIYDTLEFSVKIWILNRVSIYIVAMICILYFLSFIYYDLFTSNIVTILFTLRILAIAFQFIIDFCIDLEIEYDFYERTIHKLDIPYCLKSQQRERLALLHISNYNELSLADNWKFIGTKCSWTADNVFRIKFNNDNYENGLNTSYYRCPFNIMFIFTYCIIGIPLIIFMIISVLSLSFIKIICCRKGKKYTILDECCHRYSY